jgi:hypothetical protein
MRSRRLCWTVQVRALCGSQKGRKTHFGVPLTKSIDPFTAFGIMAEAALDELQPDGSEE